MGRAFGFITLIAVVAVGAWIYMRQTQSVMTAGTSSPTATVDLMGVRSDLLAIAQAERSHAALQAVTYRENCVLKAISPCNATIAAHIPTLLKSAIQASASSLHGLARKAQACPRP